MYLFEDADGRKELEEQLQLLANSVLHRNVVDKTPVFHPPSAEAARGDIPIGKVAYNGKELHEFGLRRDEVFQHTAIFGRSGAGKTNLGFLLLRNLMAQGIPVMAFDWKKNFRDMLAVTGCENLKVYTVGRMAATFRFNPLIPPRGVDAKSHLKRLSYVLAHAFYLGDGCIFLISTVLDSLYRDAGVYRGVVVKYPTFRDLLKRLKSYPVQGREANWMSSALRAIASLCFGQMDFVVNSDGNAGMEELLRESVVFEMESLTQADKVFFIESILLWLHEVRMRDQNREQLIHVTVLEEAHHILSKKSSRGAFGEPLIETIFREIREFGEGLILMDQHPSEIALTALGNTYTTIAMNLKSRTDVSVMAAAMLLKDNQQDMLGQMEVGKAVVKLQGRIAEPFLISIPRVEVVKGLISDESLAGKMRPNIGEVGEGPGEDIKLTENELAFLLDVASVADCGVVARYTRVRLSGRQGDKVKRSLLDAGLVEEIEKTTPNSRKKVLRLTEEGKRVCAVNASRESEKALIPEPVSSVGSTENLLKERKE